MALVKGTNSYVTVAEADAYFETRIDVAAWSEANELEKSKALVTATQLLDEVQWSGVASSDTQPLAFPRTGSYMDPKLGFIVEYKSETPSRILIAVYETAYHLLNNDGLLDDSGSVRDISLGSIGLSLIRSANKLPSTVRQMIAPMKKNGGSHFWWRAN